ncbi:MAG TPA: barstar family protein [Thiobacillaceae bacterium]|nr:barstar family protein [Thiobacillaceae bacterium]HNA83349.1 barstar family protein [Thiobacillaceae bacterium]HNF89506.1 barstar family protein [Thiobacillaceae bacterium]HNH89844.1 barstar family protein [Thiobacillaceae bacterium]HNI07006.1 barstar family protein [Thiobacillaceae bacterium]
MPILQEIVFEPSLNGIYRLGVPPEDAPVDLVPVLDGRGLKDKASLLAALGRALDFPDYYGGNWDALEECLGDLSWRTGPIWLLVRHAGEIPTELLTLLLDILGEAACSWARLGRVFSVFLTGLDRPDLPEAF